MIKSIVLLIIIALLAGCSGGGGSSETVKEPAIERDIVFEDNFDNDLSQWNIEDKTKPWHGIYWRWNEDNVYLEDGKLVIKYTHHKGYQVGAVSSKFQTTYGYFEASIKVVGGNQGMQSCFWMMPVYRFPDHDGTGNDGLEIDILESNKASDKYSVSTHFDGYGDDQQSSGKVINAPGIHDGFNTYALDWTPNYLKFYYNGRLVRTIDDPIVIPHVDEYMILSGSFFLDYWVDGDLTKAELPAYMYVDWVRIYN